MIDLDETGLVASAEDVARMTRPQREYRVYDLMLLAYRILNDAIATEILAEKRTVAAIGILFSGGNDSTALAHLFQDVATHTVHANTGIGIEATRNFVRRTSVELGLPLVEKHPPLPYRDLVLEQAFPGPAMHWKMFTRLKERCIEAARTELVGNRGYRERVVFLAGRRRTESARRAAITTVDRKGSMVFVSPMVLWTPADINTYRVIAETVPRNEVSDLIHMSGECLCGAFAHPGELDEIGLWFPEVRKEIEELEAEVLATGKHPAWKCQWGWGADKHAIEAMRRDGYSDAEIAAHFTRSKTGIMCSSCDDRFSEAITTVVAP